MNLESKLTLSIIIVNWNTCEMLRDCLASVFATIGKLRCEILVVDNASNDGSQGMVAREFPAVKLIENAENMGFAAANNQALKIAKGTYSLLLNSDTVVHGDVIERSVVYLDTHWDVGVMGCRVLNTDGSLQPTCSQFPTLPNLLLLTSGLSKLKWPLFLDRYQMHLWDRRDERDVDVVTGCYMLVRVKAIEGVGLLDENFFFFGEETDWCRRFKNAGWKLRFAPVGEITHHGGGSARKLAYKRDLMLSSAMVKLHLKHTGVVGGCVAWCIISVFNVSRAAYWASHSLLSNDQSIRERRDHFCALAGNLHRMWPSRRTYSG